MNWSVLPARRIPTTPCLCAAFSLGNKIPGEKSLSFCYFSTSTNKVNRLRSRLIHCKQTLTMDKYTLIIQFIISAVRLRARIVISRRQDTLHKINCNNNISTLKLQQLILIPPHSNNNLILQYQHQ